MLFGTYALELILAELNLRKAARLSKVAIWQDRKFNRSLKFRVFCYFFMSLSFNRKLYDASCNMTTADLNQKQ